MCDYIIWDKKNKILDKCPESGIKFVRPSTELAKKYIKQRDLCLCQYHLSFVADAIDRLEIETAKAERKANGTLQ